MKTKAVILIFVCALCAAFALGVTGTAVLADGSANAASGGDRLVGVFLTDESISMLDDELIKYPQYPDRFYAVSTESGHGTDYDFVGVEGTKCFVATGYDASGSYLGNYADDGISDVALAVNSTDGGESVSIEGTIYVSAGYSGMRSHFNPVYQTAEGEIYTVAGSSVMFSGDAAGGSSYSKEIKEETTITGSETKTSGCAVKVNVSFIEPPVSIVLTELDGESAVVSRKEYAPGTLPESITPERETAYIIAESIGASPESTTRELYQPSDDALDTFACREDGICIKRQTAIEWRS